MAEDFRIYSDTFGRKVWCKIIPSLLTQNELKNPGRGGIQQKTLPSEACFDARLVFSPVSFQFHDHHFRRSSLHSFLPPVRVMSQATSSRETGLTVAQRIVPMQEGQMRGEKGNSLTSPPSPPCCLTRCHELLLLLLFNF